MLQFDSHNKTPHARTRAKAKMFEYNVPLENHINLEGINLSDLLDITIGVLAELSTMDEIDINDHKSDLLFSAEYFSALLEAKKLERDSQIIQILAASAFLLAGRPGSINLLVDDIEITDLEPVENLLYCLLKRIKCASTNSENTPQLNNTIAAWNDFIDGDFDPDKLFVTISALKEELYNSGSDQEVVLIGILARIAKQRFNSSVQVVLEKYTDLPEKSWEPYLRKEGRVDEFWPSQMILAEQGIFNGASAVVQMPTSAGKTRAIEFIVRSDFLRNENSLAIIVAPFRALCQEIYNDFNKYFADEDLNVSLINDVLNNDLDFDQLNQGTLMIVTPEKLDFLLKYNLNFAIRITLLVYDEGHLFDDSSRGMKYELLLASLKQKIWSSVQTVLISAVIGDAQQVKTWLIGESGILIDSKDLSPTSRNVAFVEWSNQGRNLQFVDPLDIEQSQFFVPTVLSSHTLKRRKYERVDRHYPGKQSAKDRYYKSSDIAGYLGSRLCPSGLSAVFTGTKISANSIVKNLVEAYERGFTVSAPSLATDSEVEARKVIDYIDRTLGEDSLNYKGAQLGILLHHGSVPHGLRLVTEHALQNGHFKMVVCTSTLAQGVNLPIKYLIVSSVWQSAKTIKVRDFHNLMGRAGRSGKHLEGTVIFSDPKIYESRKRRSRNQKRWTDIANLLNSTNSEPSLSQLAKLLEVEDIDDDESKNYDELQEIKADIQRYLLELIADSESVESAHDPILNLLHNTLGYTQLDNDERRVRLEEIFLKIGDEIITSVPQSNARLVYSRSILNISDTSDYLAALQEKQALLVDTASDPFDVVWEHLYSNSRHLVMNKFSTEDAYSLCRMWISGSAYADILNYANSREHESKSDLSIEKIIDLCENAFSFQLSTLLSTTSELLSLLPLEENDYKRLVGTFLGYQRRLKYGLLNLNEISIYELGMTDRFLCSEINSILFADNEPRSKTDIKYAIEESEEVASLIKNDYPSYFLDRYKSL